MHAQGSAWLTAVLAAVAAFAVPASASEPQRRCAAIKAYAAARHYQCRALQATRPVPQFAKCDAQLGRKWSAAERRADGLCPTLDDQAAIQLASSQRADGLAAALEGTQPLAPRYVDHGDGTLTDTRTGLMWEKLSDDGGIHDKDDTYGWSDAFAVKIAALNGGAFAGHTDWRLPNINELRSIMPLRMQLQEAPIVSAAFHHDCLAGCTVLTCSCTSSGGVAYPYWSSTSVHSEPETSWGVEAASSTAGSIAKSGPFNPGFVRAVRGGS